MEFSRADVRREGEVLAHGIGIYYEVFTNPRSGMVDWRGYIDASSELVGVFWNLGNYQLAFEDGRVGEIVVNNVDFTAPEESGQIHFLGAGPLE